MTASKQFHKFEARADAIAASLVRGKPARSVVTVLNIGAAILALRSGSVGPGGLQGRGIGATKIGYLMPLIRQADPAFQGLSAYDAVGAWGSDEASVSVARNLYAYSEFCEVAPFVHRGCYTETSSEANIDLNWRTANFGAVEAKDVVVSNLSNPFAVHDKRPNRAWYAEKSLAPDLIPLAELLFKVKEMVPWFCENYFELSPLSDEAMRAAVNVGTKSFVRFRAACMALAEVHTELISAIVQRSEANDDFALAHQEDLLNLTAPCWKIDFTQQMIASLAEIDLDEVRNLMTVYSSAIAEKESRAEGFAPPFIASGDTYIFGPLVTQHMMSSRNVLYTCLKHDRRRFDDKVSRHLEPQLIATATEMLAYLDDVEIVSNVVWSAGEIDILVYRSSENAVLVLEAKAAVAPEGARMIERSEERVNEALEQLQRFSELSPEQRDQVLSHALGKTVESVDVSTFVLTWSSFGTEAVWSKFGTIAPLNVALLAELVRRNKTTALRQFAQLAHELVREVVAATDPTWSPLTRRIGELSFTSPVLEYRGEALCKYQAAPFKLLRRSSNWPT